MAGIGVGIGIGIGIGLRVFRSALECILNGWVNHNSDQYVDHNGDAYVLSKQDS